MAGKRANGEGTVARRDDGRWEARFSYVDVETGARRRASAYGKTRAEARAKMEAKRGRVAEGLPVSDSRTLFSDWAARWSATSLAASNRKAQTKDAYRGVARRLAAGRLGTMPLDKIRRSDVEALLLSMTESGLAPSTVRQALTVLHVILAAAQREGLLARNPSEGVERPALKHHEARFLTPTEVGRLLAEMRGDRLETFARFLLLTGLRRGEALALCWRDIDMSAGVLRVRGTLARVGGTLVVSEPKTTSSRRAVPLSEAALGILRAQLERQEAERQLHEGRGLEWPSGGYVFATPIGTPTEPRNALRAVQGAATRAGLTGVGLHSLRHSSASAMLNAGVPLRAVADVLGHSATTVTANIYAHVAPEVRRAAADVLAAAFDANDDANPEGEQAGRATDSS